MYWALDGPSVRVNTPGKPQSLLSVPGLHSTAYVVAVASEATIDATRGCTSAPGIKRLTVLVCAREVLAMARANTVALKEYMMMRL